MCKISGIWVEFPSHGRKEEKKPIIDFNSFSHPSRTTIDLEKNEADSKSEVVVWIRVSKRVANFDFFLVCQ